MDDAHEHNYNNEVEQQRHDNWSESVEDLVAARDTDGAISLLESVISNLATPHNPSSSSSDPQLVSALTDLAKLYSSKGFSLKADQLHSRASLIHHRLLHSSSSSSVLIEDLNEEKQGLSASISLPRDESSKDGNVEEPTKLPNDASPINETSDDDWEAIADRSPDELLSSKSLLGVSELSLEDSKPKAPKRRGRGTFSYKKHELYSDHLSEKTVSDNTGDEGVGHGSERNMDIRYCKL